MKYLKKHIEDHIKIAETIDLKSINKILDLLIKLKKRKSKIASIIGRKKGYLKKISDACCVVPDVNKKTITPHTETYQVFIWHMLVSHPKLQIIKTVW